MVSKVNWTEISESGYQALLRQDFDAAERYFRLFVESGGSEEQDVRLAYSFLVLGKCHIQRGDYAGAEPFYRRALEIYEKVHGPDHKDVAYSLAGLAECNMNRGKYTESQLLYNRAIAIYESIYDPHHLEVGKMLEKAAQCYVLQRDHARAVPLFERCVDILGRVHGPWHEDVASCFFALARCYEEGNEDKKAELLFRRALEIYEIADEPNVEQIAHVRYNLGRCCHGQRDFSQADIFYRKAIEAFGKAAGLERNLAYASFSLATCYLHSGDYRAEAAFRNCGQIYEKTFGSDDLQMAYFLDAYARYMHNSCRSDQAKSLEQRAQRIRETYERRLD